MKLDGAERKRLEQLDLDEEVRKEKERAKMKYWKGKKGGLQKVVLNNNGNGNKTIVEAN